MMEVRYKKTTLPNGIRVVSENVDFVHSIALGLWVLAGSHDEDEEANGIAHFLEHMAFKGTTTRSAFQIAHTIESLGGILNAFTSKDLTCYFARLMYEDLETGIEVLSDLILNPAFDKEEIKREKRVIIEEIKEIEDTPSELIYDYFFRDLYPNHPLGRPIQGTIKSVKSFTSDQLKEFIKTNYSSDRIVISASGKVDHEQLVELVTKYLKGIQAGNGRREFPEVQPISKYKRFYATPTAQSYMVLGRRIFSRDDPRKYQLALLNVILSGGMSSRLFNNIRQKYGFVYAIYSFADFYSKEGLFGIYAGVDTQKLEEVQSMIYREIEKLVNKPVHEEEIEKAKQQFKGGLVISLESMQARMSRLANMEIFEKRILSVDELLKIIDEISSKDLQNLAEYLFVKDAFIETVIQPKL